METEELSAISGRRILHDLELTQYICAVLFGAGINVAVGFVFIPAGLYQVLGYVKALSPQFQYLIPTSQDMVILSLTYFIVGILYSVMASLAFDPKRIVSPRQVQLASSGLFTINWITLLGNTPFSSWPIAVLLASYFFALAFLIFLAVGIPQTRIVRWLVGLNGSEADFSGDRYLVYDKVANVYAYLDEGLPYEWNLDSKILKQETYFFRTDSRERHQLFIVLCPDPSDHNLTQIAVIYFIKRAYGIESEYTNDYRSKMQTIVRIVRSHKVKCDEQDEPLNPAETKALHYARSVLEPKALFFKEMPRRTIWVLIIFSVLAGLFSYLRYVNILPEPTYYEFWVLGGLYIATELLPNLKRRRGLSGSPSTRRPL